MDKNSHSIQQRDTIDGKVQNAKMYPSFGNIVSIRHLEEPKFHRKKNPTIYKIYSHFVILITILPLGIIHGFPVSCNYKNKAFSMGFT